MCVDSITLINSQKAELEEAGWPEKTIITGDHAISGSHSSHGRLPGGGSLGHIPRL